MRTIIRLFLLLLACSGFAQQIIVLPPGGGGGGGGTNGGAFLSPGAGIIISTNVNGQNYIIIADRSYFATNIVSGNTFSNVVFLGSNYVGTLVVSTITSSNYNGDARYLTNTIGTNMAIASQMGVHGDARILNDGQGLDQATGGTDDTKLLQSILDSATNHHGFELVIDVPCVVTGLFVYANTTIRCSGRGGLYLKDNSNQIIVHNAHPSTNHTYLDYNIRLIGGFYFGNGTQQAAVAGPQNGDAYNNGIGFYGVSNIWIQDVTIRDPAFFHAVISDWQDIVVENLTFQPIVIGADGIDLFGGNNAYLHNIRGSDSTDFIAVDADAYLAGEVTTWALQHGDISHVLIDGVYFDDNTTEGISLLAQKNNITDVTIRNVSGSTANHVIRLWTFWPISTGGQGGIIDGVLLENINATGNRGNLWGNFPTISLMEFDNAPLHVKNVQIKNCRWRDYGGAFIIGPPVNNNHTNAVIEQMQISGISVLETNVGVTSTLTNRALVYCPNGVIFTNLMISDVMWTRSTNSAVGNRDFIVFNDVGGIINNLSLDNLVLSTNMASTITNAGTILKTNAPIMFNGGVNAIVGTDGGDRLGAHLKTLVIGSGLSSDGTTLTATGGGGSGSASNAVSAILTNSVSIAASGVIESNLNLIGNDITVTGAVSSGQANIGLTVSSNTLKGVVLINPTANGLSVTGASPGTITFSNSAGTARQIFIDGPNAQTTDTNGFSSDFVNFMRPPTNAAFSGAVVMATGASGATAFREAATNAFLLTSGALLIGNGGNGINSSGNGFSGSDGHWLTNATKNFPLVIDDVYERGRFQITNTQGTNTLTSSNMSIVPIGNTSVGYSSDSSHYTQMPTNTPTDTYVMTAVGTAGNTKWAASSGGAGGAPTITQTNWLINNVYTVGAAPILALAYVSLQGPATAAAGAGGIMSIYADQAGGSTFVQIASVTNGVALQPTVAVLLEGVLKAGATFYITNESVGTGANAIFGNQGYTVTLTGATGATGATGPAPFPLNADTNVGNFGLTNVAYININSNINYSTNTGGIIPDMRKGYQMITTNAAFTFLAPIGVDTTKTLAQTAVVFITNSTAAAVVMTPQVAWHIQGTWYVTNVSSITVFQYAQVFTNAVALPLW